ncbi:hypothetical protein V6Z11_D13G188500 [Gossypium hirsutum]
MAPTLADPFNDSSTLVEFVINQGNGVKGLSKLGLTALPKQYIQPLEERMCMTNIIPQGSIPIIDMSNWEDPKVVKSIWDAASKWGFFQIVNYDVPVEVLENVKDATYNFFRLPAKVGTSVTPQAEKALEWKDYLSLFYAKESLLMGSIRTNLNYYPKCPNPKLTVGVGRHSDVPTLTILLQEEIRGLFVRGNEGGDWIHVPPIKGSLVINVGDALQIMSNGRYRSVEHRVPPFFVNPRPTDMIGPLPELVANGEIPIYKQVLYSDYVKHFFRKAHDGKKTVEFAEL